MPILIERRSLALKESNKSRALCKHIRPFRALRYALETFNLGRLSNTLESVMSDP